MQKVTFYKSKFWVLITVLLSFTTIRCSDALLPKVASIETKNPKMVLPQGGNQTLTAIPKDDSGNIVTEVNINWSSDHPGVASINGQIVEGKAIGSALLTASVGDVTSPPVEVWVVTPHEGLFAISRINPDNQLANVAVSPEIRVEFNRHIDQTTISEAAYYIAGPNGKVSGTLRYEPETWSIIFTPNKPLARRTTYVARVTTGLKDELGNSLPNDFFWTFTTEGANGPPAAVHFGAPYIYRTGMGAYNIAVDDLNQDGHLDIVVTNTEENYISVLMGDGSGDFASPIQILTDGGTHGVSIGDLNHDGWADLVVANHKGGTVSVILNNTATAGGPFLYIPAVNMPVGNHPSYIAIADFNGDAQQDLAISDDVDLFDNPNGEDPETGDLAKIGAINVLFGNGDGTFGPPNHYGTHGQGTHTVVAGDLNQDGMIDLLATDRRDADLSIFMGDGQGNFSLAFPITFPRWNHSVVLGDLDQDGRPDLVVENREYVSVLLNRTPPGSKSAQFAPTMHYLAGAGPAYSSIGDLNGDGFLDVAVATNGAASVSILLGDGTGFLSHAISFPTGPGTHAVTMGDFNEDGRLDLVAGNQFSDLASVLINSETDLFASPVNLPTKTNPNALTSADWDGDGLPDLAATSPIIGRFSIFQNQTPNGGAPTFSKAKNHTLGGFPIWLGHADINGDGKEDLAFLQRDIHQGSFYLGDGSGLFAPSGEVSLGTQLVSATFGDWDKDGKIDLAVINSVSNDVTILRSTTVIGATTVTMIPLATLSVGPAHPEINPATGLKITGQYTGDIITSDFDHDGEADLAVVTRDENQLTIFKGDGTGGFSILSTVSGFNAPVKLGLGEFTGDKEPDLAILNVGSDEVWVIPGDGTGLFTAPPQLNK